MKPDSTKTLRAALDYLNIVKDCGSLNEGEIKMQATGPDGLTYRIVDDAPLSIYPAGIYSIEVAKTYGDCTAWAQVYDGGADYDATFGKFLRLTMNQDTLDKIDRTIAASGCSTWEIEHETTLYLTEKQMKGMGCDCITYYRGGYGYPFMCFVKERLAGGNYGVCKHRVGYATPEEFLSVLNTQVYLGGTWRYKGEN